MRPQAWACHSTRALGALARPSGRRWPRFAQNANASTAPHHTLAATCASLSHLTSICLRPCLGLLPARRTQGTGGARRYPSRIGQRLGPRARCAALRPRYGLHCARARSCQTAALPPPLRFGPAGARARFGLTLRWHRALHDFSSVAVCRRAFRKWRPGWVSFALPIVQ